jgi:hypothetical protein
MTQFARNCFFFMTLIFAAASTTLMGQVQATYGSIQGDVTDASGAAVPDAAVEADEIDTAASHRVQTDSSGHFEFPSLPPGPYTVKISKSGFATTIQENLNLTVGRTASLKLALQVAGQTESIIVTSAPVIDVVTDSSSTTLGEQTIATTPVLGRKFEDLVTMTPGVSIVQGPDGDEININGQRGIFNNISLDGGDYNNGFFGEQSGGQRAAVDITLEAVKEFQIVASGANAEFGHTGGGVVNVITKSGTNNFHGSLFEYQRLESLTANTSDGKPLTDFHREQFGGAAGGYIVLPGLQPHRHQQRSAHQLDPRLSASGSAHLLQDQFQRRRGPTSRPCRSQRRFLRPHGLQPEPEEPALRLLQLRLLPQSQPDLRRCQLRHHGQRH